MLSKFFNFLLKYTKTFFALTGFISITFILIILFFGDTSHIRRDMIFGYFNSMMGIVIKEIRKTNKILDYHLVQKRTMGDMKPRYLAIDTVSKKGNRHEVFITNKEKINDKPPMVLTLKGN